MAKERALDVFQLLSKIDRKDYGIWDSLTEEQKKEFAPVVVMRWMAGTTDPVQLIFLNEIVNPSVFPLGSDHKEFLMKLLTVCASGGPKRYGWVNYKIASSKKPKRAIELVASHYKISIADAEDTVKLFTNEEILELALEHGMQKDEISELKKELPK